jgi:hypothetical protein
LRPAQIILRCAHDCEGAYFQSPCCVAGNNAGNKSASEREAWNRDSAQLENCRSTARLAACANHLQRALNREASSIEYSCCYANARTSSDLEPDAWNRDSAQLENCSSTARLAACANYLQRTLNREAASLEYSCCYANARTVTDLEQDALNRDFEQLSNCSSTLVQLAACAYYFALRTRLRGGILPKSLLRCREKCREQIDFRTGSLESRL